MFVRYMHTLILISLLGMSDNESEESPSDVQLQLKRLQEENDRLRQEQQANSTAALIKELSKLHSQVPKPDKPTSELPQYLEYLSPSEKTDNCGDPVDDNICKALTTCWWEVFRREEIVEMLEQQVRPSNALALKPLEINPDVPLSRSDKINDREMRYLGNAICGAAKGLTYLLDMVIKAEEYCKEAWPEDSGSLVMENFEFDFPASRNYVLSALRLLGMANVQTGQARRALLTSKFKPDFQKLCDRDKPFTDGKFFGPNFNATAALVRDTNQAHNTVFQTAPRGRGGRFRRSRGRRYTPYTPTSAILQAAVMQHALSAAAKARQQQPTAHGSQPGIGGVFNPFQPIQQPYQAPSLLQLAQQLQPRGRPSRRRRGRQGRR